MNDVIELPWWVVYPVATLAGIGLGSLTAYLTVGLG